MTLETGIPVAIFLLLATSLEAGFRFGRRAVTPGGAATGAGQLGAIQGALLGLLGLLLGFSFAGAASRFIERQDLIVQEANAIGTAYLRADLLDAPYRSELRDSLKQYVEHRLRVSAQLRHGVPAAAKAEINQMHDRIWKAASQGVAAKPAAMLGVLPPVNEVIDLHSTRLAAGRKHLPTSVVGLLVICSTISIAAIGYGCGLSSRRSLVMTGPLVFVVAAAFWITIDLDHPRAGLIQLSDAPLKELTLVGGD
jgi:hypothetical protein